MGILKLVSVPAFLSVIAFLTAVSWGGQSTVDVSKDKTSPRKIAVYRVVPAAAGAKSQAMGISVEETSSAYRGYVNPEDVEKAIQFVTIAVHPGAIRQTASVGERSNAPVEIKNVEINLKNAPVSARKGLGAAFKNSARLDPGANKWLMDQMRAQVADASMDLPVEITMFISAPLTLYGLDGAPISKPLVRPRARAASQ